MRTGSNLLEASLNAVAGVQCLGELYNPAFVGFPKSPTALGYDVAAREADPQGLFTRMAMAPGLNGFRWFHDHDPRAFNLAMGDATCAKIVLTRRPLDSYISLKIARQTGQWKLGDLKHRKGGTVAFEAAEFAAYLAEWQAYQARIKRGLQGSGQTGFYLDYDDLGSLEVMNGLLAHLGVADRLAMLPQTLVPQNPGPISDKVENFAAMGAALAALDPFGAQSAGLSEAQLGPGVPRFVAATGAPVLFLPIAGGPLATVTGWLSGLGAGQGVTGGFTQGSLRQWMRDNPAHQTFCILRHPVRRAFAAFEALADSEDDAPIRQQLARSYKLTLPKAGALMAMPGTDLRAALLAFLAFLKGNLDGQTGVRTDPAWSSQSAVLAAMSQVVMPDLVAREATLASDLALVTTRLNLPPTAPTADAPSAQLAAICDAAVEKAVRQIYQRDYVSFGFGRYL